MIKKYSILTGIIISIILLSIAMAIYPGGSMFDKNTTGFSFTKNFISNLFGSKALNGAHNPSRIWALLAMLILPFTYALFFSSMAKKIPNTKIANIVKYAGLANIFCTFLIVTALHDLMLNISITLFWSNIVFITAFIFKTRLWVFKILCIICVLIFYYSIFLWATNNWVLLPILQKINFINSTLLIIALEYFTTAQDFTARQMPAPANTSL
jgi:hypothetical protein